MEVKWQQIYFNCLLLDYGQIFWYLIMKDVNLKLEISRVGRLNL